MERDEEELMFTEWKFVTLVTDQLDMDGEDLVSYDDIFFSLQDSDLLSSGYRGSSWLNLGLTVNSWPEEYDVLGYVKEDGTISMPNPDSWAWKPLTRIPVEMFENENARILDFDVV